MTKLHAEGIGTVCGKLYVGTAEYVPPSELIDTTGAGDAFIGSVLYGNLPNLFYIFSSFPPKGHMQILYLPFLLHPLHLDSNLSVFHKCVVFLLISAICANFTAEKMLCFAATVVNTHTLK